MGASHAEDLLGARRSLHRASGLTWLAGGLLSCAGAAAAYQLATPANLVRLAIGAAVMGGLAVWMLLTAWRLRGVAVAVHERGLAYRGRAQEADLAWAHVSAIEVELSPLGRTVAIVLATPHGRLVLPGELRGFDQLADAIDAAVPLPWQRRPVTLASRSW